eukprot:Partr_v1_DN20052_c0_g2_i1_m21361 putative Aspartate aminotransferase
MSRAGVWGATPTLPPTVIFHLTARYKADTHPRKLNLGVGAYRDETLKPYVFSAVRKAEQAVVNAGFDKEYLPITGSPAFTAAAAKLLFGADSAAVAEKRLGTCQTLSGTGALTVAAHLIKRTLPGRRIFCSDPTWENHGKVLADAGAGKLESYRYYDAGTCGLDEAGLLGDLRAMPEGSIVLLHACAHNPTGVDPTQEQWKAIADIMEQRSLLPWFDIAYQGFASGDPETDAWAVRYFASRGFEMLVCQSFAKNFGLYCERVGALHVLAADAGSATAAMTQLEALIRPMYSNPPAHGARVVAHILNTPELAAEWKAELGAAMARVSRMRTLLRDALVARGTPGNWDHIVKQIGMFSYTGLNPAQCERMVEECHVYMLASGRINVAGLNAASIPIAADAIHAVVTGAPAPAV